MAKIGRKATDYELIEGGVGGGRGAGSGSISGGGSRTRPDSPMSKKPKGMNPAIPAAFAGTVAVAGPVGGAASSHFREKRREAEERDKTVVNTENMRRAAAKPKDESARRYKGGAIKKMATGGSVSKRADGIAKRGKTKGRVC